MSEFNLSHMHVSKYKKVEKLNTQLIKERQKAIKAKAVPLKSKVTKDKIIFKDKKEVVLRADIEKTNEYKNDKILIIVTKVDKKKAGHIFVFKFDKDEDYDKCMAALKPREQQPPEPSTPVEDHVEQPRRASITTSRSSSSSSSTSDYSPAHSRHLDNGRSPVSPAKTPPKAVPAPTPPRSFTPVHNQDHHWEAGVATFVTTDVLTKRRSSKSAQRKAKVDYLNYVPGRGMVKSPNENVYLYSERKRNDSESSTSSSSTSPSASLAFDEFKGNIKTSQIYKVVSKDRSYSSSNSSRSRSSSSTSLSGKDKGKNRPDNVHLYRNFRSSSSSLSSDSNTLDRPIVMRQSRPKVIHYVECPTCHHRSRSRH